MSVVKKCCGLCPFARKGTLFLHPDRASDFAYSAENPYNDFVCHKTGVTHEDHPDEDRQNEIGRGAHSLTCAGFHALQNAYNDTEPQIPFDPVHHWLEPDDMIAHHEDEYYKTHKPTT